MATSNFKSTTYGIYILDTDEMDDFIVQDSVDEMQAAIDAVDNPVYDLSLQSGYYSGIQIIATVKQDFIDPDSLKDNELIYLCDADYMNLHHNRWIATRQLKKAKKDLIKSLDSIARDLNLIKLSVAARFSNGETIYNKEEIK